MHCHIFILLKRRRDKGKGKRQRHEKAWRNHKFTESSRHDFFMQIILDSLNSLKTPRCHHKNKIPPKGTSRQRWKKGIYFQERTLKPAIRPTPISNLIQTFRKRMKENEEGSIPLGKEAHAPLGNALADGAGTTGSYVCKECCRGDSDSH